MKVLVIGSGGREHAIVDKLYHSLRVSEVHALPGNPGMEKLATCHPIAVNAYEEIVTLAVKESFDMVIVGPEQPLVDGLGDTLRQQGIKVFGPGEAGARLEGSKIYAKEFMDRYQVPTAPFAIISSYEEGLAKLEAWNDYPVVIKVDGLAGGKGVLIPHNLEEAKEDLKKIFQDHKFGSAGKRVLLERFISGFEASFLCLVDGKTIKALASARDYKRALDGDQGLNTGGMGAVSPNEKLTREMLERVEQEVLGPTLVGIQQEGFAYHGVLFIGVIMDAKGHPHVLEYNVRFGDPETQVVLPRLENDLFTVFESVIEGSLAQVDLRWKEEAAACLILTSGGYPEAYEKGKVIQIKNPSPEVTYYHAGTKRDHDQLLTDGGRVLGLTALGKTHKEALQKVYDELEHVTFDQMAYRRDIGQ